MSSAKLPVIIPAYNEEKTLESTCARLDAFLSAHYPEYEIVFVNDGSSDRTGEIIRALAGRYPSGLPAGYEKNRGKGCAVRTGMLAAGGDCRLFTDCDLAYGTDVILSLTEKMTSCGADVVIGSRALDSNGYDGYSFLRRTMSKCYMGVIRLLTGFRHSDSQTGLKAFSGEAARKIFPYCAVDSFAFDLEALLIAEKRGLKIEEFPCRVIENRERESKVNPVKDALKMLRDISGIKKRISKIDFDQKIEKS